MRVIPKMSLFSFLLHPLLRFLSVLLPLSNSLSVLLFHSLLIVEKIERYKTVFLMTCLFKEAHERHQGQMYQCDICQMQFSQKANMHRHRMRHSGVKPYQCRYCLKRFFRKDQVIICCL